MTNVQSVITNPSLPSGAVILDDDNDDNDDMRINFVSAGATKTATKTKANPTNVFTAEQACKVAFDYGVSMAGMDGNLTRALIAFKDDETVQAEMLVALNVGYMMRKLSYDKTKATTTVAKLKYNEKKPNDNHRTFDEQRVMDNVRVVWHRAQKMAGIIKPKSEDQIKAEVARAANEAKRKETISGLVEVLHPKDNDVNVDEAMTRLVSTMKGYYSKHAAKFTGDKGAAWRDWLANAPSSK